MSDMTPEQKNMVDLWTEHTDCEFATKNVEDTMKTMSGGPHVNHVPVMTGGYGTENVVDFYSTWFIPCQPPDVEIEPVSRTVGSDAIVDELIFKFTHTVDMPWMLPGIPPTGKRVEIPIAVVVGFKDGKIASEHIYWDQASVLVQLGLLDPEGLPVAGVETARKVLDPSLPSNTLIKKHVR
jgi:carboxymethylenebutenolidase